MAPRRNSQEHHQDNLNKPRIMDQTRSELDRRCNVLRGAPVCSAASDDDARSDGTYFI